MTTSTHEREYTQQPQPFDLNAGVLADQYLDDGTPVTLTAVREIRDGYTAQVAELPGITARVKASHAGGGIADGVKAILSHRQGLKVWASPRTYLRDQAEDIIPVGSTVRATVTSVKTRRSDDGGPTQVAGVTLELEHSYPAGLRGWLPRREMGEDLVEGDVIEVSITSVDLSRNWPSWRCSQKRLLRDEAEDLMDVYTVGTLVETQVTRTDNSGVFVDFGPLRAWCPKRLLDGSRVDVGDTITVVVTEHGYDRSGDPQIVVSQSGATYLLVAANALPEGLV